MPYFGFLQIIFLIMKAGEAKNYTNIQTEPWSPVDMCCLLNFAMLLKIWGKQKIIHKMWCVRWGGLQNGVFMRQISTTKNVYVWRIVGQKWKCSQNKRS